LTLEQAMEDPQWKQWEAAIEEEYQSLVENGTWTPNGNSSQGEVVRFKPDLVYLNVFFSRVDHKIYYFLISRVASISAYCRSAYSEVVRIMVEFTVYSAFYYPYTRSMPLDNSPWGRHRPRPLSWMSVIRCVSPTHISWCRLKEDLLGFCSFLEGFI
jgi:hypothetical protein